MGSFVPGFLGVEVVGSFGVLVGVVGEALGRASVLSRRLEPEGSIRATVSGEFELPRFSFLFVGVRGFLSAGGRVRSVGAGGKGAKTEEDDSTWRVVRLEGEDVALKGEAEAAARRAAMPLEGAEARAGVAIDCWEEAAGKSYEHAKEGRKKDGRRQ